MKYLRLMPLTRQPAFAGPIFNGNVEVPEIEDDISDYDEMDLVSNQLAIRSDAGKRFIQDVN